MKNKKLTYFLLLLVISLWGYLIYKVFGAVSGTNEEISNTRTPTAVIENLDYYKIKAHDSLLLNYRDPLYTVDSKPSSTVIDPAPVAATAPVYNYPPVHVVPETPIAYNGFIENENNRKRVAIVNINNKQHMIGKGESQDGVSVLDIQNDHIRIKHKGNTKTIYK